MKKAIYTVITGNYDTLKPAPTFKGWDAVLFTDNQPKDSKGWTVRLIDQDPGLSDRKLSRKYKILSHIYLSEYNLVCYIDANIKLLKEPPNTPIHFLHPSRKSVFFEARAIVDLRKGCSIEVRKQMDYYKSQRFPDNCYLFANGFFVRDHSEETNKLFSLWWSHVEHYSHRDQLSLPYCIWKTGIKLKRIAAYYTVKQYITYGNHVAESPGPVRVHHITPATSDKNFGYIVNQAIDGLPDNDWICLRDIDTFPPYHEEFIKQVDIIANGNHNFDLIGCMTNRLGLKYQLVPGMFDITDLKAHRDVAKKLSNNRVIKPLNNYQTIGGLMMLFSKKTWLKAGKFPEGGIQINGKFVDYYFSRAVCRFGKLGIAEGIYLYHNYRVDYPNTRDAISHLIT